MCVILKARLGVPMNIGYSEFFKVLYKQIISSTLYIDEEYSNLLHSISNRLL